jgi:hypothetical protein
MQNTEESFGCGETRIKNSTSRRTQRASAPDQANAECHVLGGFPLHTLREESIHGRLAVLCEDRLVVDFDQAEVDPRSDADIEADLGFVLGGRRAITVSREGAKTRRNLPRSPRLRVKPPF